MTTNDTSFDDSQEPLTGEQSPEIKQDVITEDTLSIN